MSNGAATLANLRERVGTLSFAAVRDFHEVDIATDDFVQEAGFCAVARSAGNVTVRCLGASGDITVTVAAGAWIGPRADVPAALRAIRAGTVSVYIVRL